MSDVPGPQLADVEAAERDILDSGEAGGKAIRGGLIRTVGHVGAMGMSLVSVPFMIRHLGDVDYGYYMTVSSLIFIIGGMTEAGLNQLGIKRYSAMDAGERPGFLRVLVGLRLALTVTGVALATAFSAATGQPGVVVAGTAIMGLGLLLQLTQNAYAVALSSQLKLGWVAGLEFIGQFTLSAVTLALVAVGASLIPFFWAAVASAGALLVVTVTVLRRDTEIRPSIDVEQWRSILREVLPFALAAAVGLIYFRLAIILMSYLATDQETGIYSAAQRIVETVGVIPWLVVSAGFPILARAARDDADRLKYALQRLFDVSLLLGGAVVVTGVAGAQFAIKVVAGVGFGESVGVLQILICSMLMTFLVATWSSALLSLSEYRRILWSNLVALATTTILSVALIPGMGPEGAAIATVAAETALAISYLIALARHDRTLLPHAGTVGRLLPGAAVAAAAGLLLGAPSLIESLLCGAIYLAGAWLCGAVPPELVDALLRRAPQPAPGS
jgi:O-antigen/teichoic acid export membrane protein